MDEKGCMVGVVGKSKRIFDRASWDQKIAQQPIQDGNREWITIVGCICADGSALPPAIIYPGGQSIQSSWVNDIEAGKHDVFVTASSSGWTNNDIGLSWLEQVFNRYTKRKARRQYRLLIVDGHGSHLTIDFLNYCDKHKILLAVLPPHSTHTLQPLDVGCFSSLASAYTKELTNYLQKSQGLIAIKKGDFFSIFWSAWMQSMITPTILSAFRATGIAPLQPSVVLDKLRHQSNQESDSSQSSQSYYSGDNWPKIHSLLRQTITENTKESRKLSRTVHHQSAQISLLKHELQGLKEAVQPKKKRTKKATALPLQQRQEYSSRAIFWSPKKLREARVRQQVFEQEEEQERVRKADIKELQKANRLYKEKLAEEKRLQRREAQVAREKERAEKATKRERQKQARNAAKAIQLSQKGKKRASSPSQPKKKR